MQSFHVKDGNKETDAAECHHIPCTSCVCVEASQAPNELSCPRPFLRRGPGRGAAPAAAGGGAGVGPPQPGPPLLSVVDPQSGASSSLSGQLPDSH